MNVGKIEGTITLRDQFTPVLNRVAGQMTAAGQQMSKFGKHATELGHTLSTKLSLPIIAVGAASLHMAHEFEKNMTMMRTLVGLSAETVKGFSKDIMRISRETAKAPAELADALYFITSAGVSGADALDALGASARGSALGLGEATAIANAATSVMNAYGVANISASKATNILALAVRAGKLEADELAPVMGRIVPMASAMSVAFEDVAGAMAAMSLTGLNAAEAAVSLNAFLSLLAKGGTKAGKDTMDALGLSFQHMRDLIREPGGIIEAMREIVEATNAVDEETLAKVIPEIRALRGVMNITAQDAAKVKGVMGQVASGIDVLGDGMNTISKQAGFQFGQMLTEMKISMIELGDQLVPALRVITENMMKVAHGIGAAAEAFGHLPKFAQTTTLAFFGLAAAIGPMISLVGNLAKAYAGLGQAGAWAMVKLGPVGLILTGIAVVVTGLSAGFATMSARMQGAMDKMASESARAGRAWQVLREYLSKNGLAELTAQDLTDVKAHIAGMTKAIKDYEKQIKDLGKQEVASGGEKDFSIAKGRIAIEIERLKKEIAQYQQILDSAYLSTQTALNPPPAAGGGDGGGGGFAGLSKEELEELTSALRSLEGELDPIAGVVNDFTDRYNTLTEAFKNGLMPPERYAELMRKLSEEFSKARAEAEALVNPLKAITSFEKFDVPRPTPDSMQLGFTEAGMKTALDAVTKLKTEQAQILNQQEAINILVNLYGYSVAEATKLVTALGGETEKAADEWAEYKKQVDENFVRGIQDALSGFFEEFFQSGELNFKKLVDSFKSMLFKMLADYLARWIMTNRTMQATNAISTQPGTGNTATTATGSMAGMGAMSTVGLYVAAFAALYEIGKSIMAAKKAKSYGFGTTYNFDYASGVGTTVTEGASQASQAISAAMRQLSDAFRQSTGAWVTAMEGVTIMARNDGKAFAVRMGEVAIGTFKTMGEAVVAAFAAAMSTASFSSQLDPAIQQMLKFASSKAGAGTFDSPEALLEAVNLIQKLSTMGQGLTETSIAVQKLYGDFTALESQLKSLGVSSADATRLAGNALIDSLSTMRDSITGRQKTAAEEMALRQQGATLFNAQVALVRSELELRKYELEQRLALLTRMNGEVPGGGTHPETQYPTSGEGEQQPAYHTMGSVVGDALAAQVKMYGIWAEATTNATAGALSAQVQMSNAAASAISAQAQLIIDQINAINAILAAMPKPIDFKEIKLNRGGKAGGASGPSKADRHADAADAVADLANQLLPQLVQQSLALREQFADLRAEMAALGMSTAELDALEAQHRARLEQEAMAQVAQYTQSPYQLALAEILAWGVEMTAVYEELGLSLEEVQEAEQARLDALIAQAESAVGLPQVSQQWTDMADALEFLKSQLDAGAISAEDYAQALEAAGNTAMMSLMDSLMEFAGNEEEKLALEQMRWAAELANIMLQFEFIKSLNILTEEQIALVQGLIDKAGEAGPPTGSTGGGFSGGTGGGPRDVGKEQDNLAEQIKNLVKALRDWLDSLRQDTTISPLTLGQRFALAQQEWLSTLATASNMALPAATRMEAAERLQELGSQYLELAAQMFGTASPAYQTIFDSVVTAIESLIGAFEMRTDWQLWFQYADRWEDYLSDSTDYLAYLADQAWQDAGNPGGYADESASGSLSRMSTPGSRALALDPVERAVRETGTMIADEVCRTGDATVDALRDIKRSVDRPARLSAADRRAAVASPTTARRRIA